MWEIQRHGSGTSGAQFRGSVWPLWADLLSKDCSHDSYTAGKSNSGFDSQKVFFLSLCKWNKTVENCLLCKELKAAQWGKWHFFELVLFQAAIVNPTLFMLMKFIANLVSRKNSANSLCQPIYISHYDQMFLQSAQALKMVFKYIISLHITLKFTIFFSQVTKSVETHYSVWCSSAQRRVKMLTSL